MRKVAPNKLTGDMFASDFNEKIKGFISAQTSNF